MFHGTSIGSSMPTTPNKYGMRHESAVDVSLSALIEEDAARLCHDVYEHCCYIGKSQIMEETLIYIISEDITRQQFKRCSQEGLIYFGEDGVDKGNYFYAVAWHVAIWHASRHRPAFKGEGKHSSDQPTRHPLSGRLLCHAAH